MKNLNNLEEEIISIALSNNLADEEKLLKIKILNLAISSVKRLKEVSKAQIAEEKEILSKKEQEIKIESKIKTINILEKRPLQNLSPSDLNNYETEIYIEKKLRQTEGKMVWKFIPPSSVSTTEEEKN